MPDRKFALVYVGSGVGNVIFATPAMRILANLGYVVDCITDRHEVRYLGIVSGLPFVRHTYTGPGPRQLYDVFLSTALRINYNPHWGKSLRPGGIFLRATSASARPDLHEAELNCAPLRELGWDGELPLPAVMAEPVHEGNHVTLFPDCKPEHEWAIKRWAPDKWIELSLRIRAVGLVPVVMSDDAKSSAWAHRGKALNLGGKTAIREAAGFIAGAKAAVGIDNGLSHVAAATNTPLVVLWGPASWVKNRPLTDSPIAKVGPTRRCSPCQFNLPLGAKQPRHDIRWPACITCDRPAPPCMNQTVDKVFAALMEVLNV